MDVSPAKRSYFTCANVWWKLLFHSTGNPSAFIFLPAPNRASAVIFPAPLFALSVEAGNALLSVLLLRLLNASS